MEIPNVTDVSNHPYIIYATLAVVICGIFFGAVQKGTTGFGAWLNSLRRIGSDARAADLAERDEQIANLRKDLHAIREQLKKRDIRAHEHIKWDWRIYNAMVKAGLWEEGDEPPSLV